MSADVLGAAGEEESENDQRRGQDLAAVRETGSAVWEPYFLGLLADVYAQEGQVEAGLATLDEALAAAQATGQRLVEAELYRLRGSLLLRQPGTSLTEVETLVAAGLGRRPPPGGKIAGAAGRDESR